MEVSIIDRSLLDDSRFQSLLASAAGHVERVVTKYKTVASWKMLGFYEGDALIGIAGYEKVSPEKAMLLHIAVDAQQRGNGIGKRMIDYICKETQITTLEAETDRSAVAFYRRSGFQITSLGEKYPGVERFQCVLHLERACV